MDLETKQVNSLKENNLLLLIVKNSFVGKNIFHDDIKSKVILACNFVSLFKFASRKKFINSELIIESLNNKIKTLLNDSIISSDFML